MLAWRLRCLLAAAAVVAALLLAGVDVDDVDPFFSDDDGDPETPEPPALSAAVRRLSARRLDEAQKERLRRDGVVVVRRALNSKKALALLLNATTATNDDSEEEHLLHPSEALVAGASSSGNWLRNGAIRALLRDGPLGCTAASALAALFPTTSETARVAETVAFHVRGGRADGDTGRRAGAHVDIDTPREGLEPMVTVWLALTRASHALEFLPGSHALPPLAGCEGETAVGHVDLGDLPEADAHTCLRALERNFSWVSHELKPGDALVFNAQVWHRSVKSAMPRSAIAVRFVPKAARFEGEVKAAAMDNIEHHWWDWPRAGAPLDGSPLFPLVHPRDAAAVGRESWPF